ncbi:MULTISPECIES: DUF742 domain-containing protein [unclassified Actinopolyspora]|uniref:DUF742 domain-containing protein n=1 Tax=unclassified Actinopolyspora TaxID=2639451 RepID=UPI0013F5E05D|nr:MULTISPECIES: DUF742 domain-containing protein [unclassified Actinopolyspora]NHD18250.1 DUF742 domain-containing protein [Actinopolyspora sp. BKK2]NHE77071.1 DUF742 domain-containing protein [Actinopolyspora sp. BKK1]
MSEGANPNWDGDLFRLYGQRTGADDWQDDFLGGPRGGGPGDHPARGGDQDSTEEYQRGLFGGPGADLFGSDRDGSGAEPGDRGAEPERGGPERPGPERGGADGGPVSMPSISQPMSPLSQSMPSLSSSMPSIPGQDGAAPEGDSEEAGSLMRPYARTRGRTRTEYELAIETLVSTSERGRAQSAQASPEHRSICNLCTDARSVAEISAHLRLPLGVVRVLIGDMAGLGLVEIHESGMVVGDRPSMEFLERVLSGLRKL